MSYKRFDQEDVVVSAESVTSAIWTGNSHTLESFYISSTQAASTSGDYYYTVYQEPFTSDAAEMQFSLAYADKKGSGSLYYNALVPGVSHTSTVYGQYRSLVLGDEEQDFKFGGIPSEYFYVISVDRARYKEKLLPGTFSLTLTHTDLSVQAEPMTITLVDDSNFVSTVSYADSGRIFELITGSLTNRHESLNANGYTTTKGSYGKFLPDVGIILLNGAALDEPIATGGIKLSTSRVRGADGGNLNRLILSMNSGSAFRLNAEETISSNFVFVRARNSEFNYTTNPSAITGSGELRHDTMINSPQAYATTVGLYNDNNDLLAVAKLSRPLLKDFTKEALVRIKLDF